MNKTISAILLAGYLITGCSSGGGTSGASGGGTTTAGGLLLHARLTTNNSSGHDTVWDFCLDVNGMVTGREPGLTTKSGTFTVTLQNLTDLTGGIFPRGVTLETYTVSYAGDSGSPVLTPRTHSATVTMTISGSPSTVTVPVILFDLGFTIPQYQMLNPSGTVYSYQVTVTFSGRSLSGDDVVISAATFLEVGNFDRC